ncbi:MAG: nucleotidyltransferase domain-containing protein [Acidobacteriota bacterium]|nr:nucleotidyltransferase domain-containing protein [Acidobacteriota bacterium]
MDSEKDRTQHVAFSDEATAAIVARLRRQREREQQRNETERQRLLRCARSVHEVARQFPAVRQLYLFGSVLIPERFCFETSDVDVGIAGRLGVEFFRLGAALDQHFDRTVELVDIDPTTPLGQWILAQGVCIYDADK